MKKLFPVALIATAAVIVVPAHASKPTDPGSQGKNHSSSRCKHSTLTKAYVFGGTLTANPTLTQTAGQATTNTTSDDRYSVDLTLTVTHANKYAKPDHAKGSTFTSTITDVVVNLGQNTDGTTRTPQSGDHVTIKARRTFKTKRNCTANANAAVGSVQYKRVGFGGQPTP